MGCRPRWPMGHGSHGLWVTRVTHSLLCQQTLNLGYAQLSKSTTALAVVCTGLRLSRRIVWTVWSTWALCHSIVGVLAMRHNALKTAIAEIPREQFPRSILVANMSRGNRACRTWMLATWQWRTTRHTDKRAALHGSRLLADQSGRP